MTNKYCVVYATATPFNVVQTASLTIAVTLALQAELYSLTQACTLTRGKGASIYTDSRYAFEVAHNFGMLWK